MMKASVILEELNKLYPNPKCSLDYSKDYEILLAVMLSAQSTDRRVNIVTKELFKYNLEELSNMDNKYLEEIIKSVGTHHKKAEYIKNIATRLLDEYGGIVPHDRNFIESLPGVGHKTCNVVFSELFDEPNMPVDTHITRISKRLNWAGNDDDVKKIELKIMKKFPKDTWNKLHLQLINFGRDICHAKKPECERCPFNEKCKRAFK